MKDLLRRLEKAMYGYNYQVTLKIDTYEYCTNLYDFEQHFKITYPESMPEKVTLFAVSHSDFWAEINEGMEYRGDSGAGLWLTPNQAANLENLQNKYRECINQCINPKTKIYIYPDYTGLPGYPVHWGYQFILQTDYYRYTFVYGCASD